MKISGLKYRKISSNLSENLIISNQIIKKKDSIIIKATDESGNHHYGEVSPLLGFSKESINDCENHLKKIISKKIIDVLSLSEELKEIDNMPSLNYGIEQLIFSIDSSKIREIPLTVVKMNKLIGIDSIAKTLKKIGNAVLIGYDTIKLKIGRKDFNEDLNILKLVRNKFGKELKLRLDNNGSWGYEDAKRNIEKLCKYNIEYIEQPVSDLNELIRLIDVSEIPIAPDESIENIGLAFEFLTNKQINYLVLKPSLRLGIFDSFKLISSADKYNVKIIITSGFETIIGRRDLLHLAAVAEHSSAHGLSILPLRTKYFKYSADFTRPLINVSDLNIEINQHSDF